MLSVEGVWAQVNGDYQTRASGNWNANTTWQVYNGGWVNCAGGDYPGATAGAGTVSILDNRTVTITADVPNSIAALNIDGGTNDSYLQFNAGFSLTVTGQTYLNSNSNNNEKSILVDAGIFRTGSLDANSDGNNRDAYVRISTGTVTVDSDITLNSTNVRTYIRFTGAGTLFVGGNMSGGGITSTVGGGTNPTSGTVNYNGSGNQNIGTYTYYNLTASNSGTKTLTGATTVRNLAIQGSATLASDVYNITGNAAGTFTMSAGTVLTLGNTGSATATTFPSAFTNANISLNNTSTVIYQSAGNQTVANAPTYGNLTIATSGTKTLAFDITVNNNLSIQGSSTLATGPRQITGNGIGTLAMDAGTTLTLGSPSTTNVVNLPTFLAYSLNATSTVVFQANVGQTVSNTPVYGNLTLSTGATATTKTATGNFTIAGNLVINNNATLSLGNAAATWNIAGSATIGGTLNFGSVIAKTINLAGNLIDATGTITMIGAGLAHTLNLDGANNALSTLTTQAGSGSTINYISAMAQQVFPSANYQNLTVSGGGTKSLTGATTINNNLTLTAGILQLGNNNLAITNNATNAIQGAAFSATNMIETNGTGYVVRNAATTLPIQFPVGAGGYYSPATINATSATSGTISVRTEQSFTLGSNYLEKFWNVLTSNTGKTITATFTYDPAEIATPPTIIIDNLGGVWQTPTGVQSFGANSFTITGTTDITNTISSWSAGSAPGTYFSYQTGSWNDPTTWTSDPGGTTQVGTTVPGDGNVVVILPSRTVTLPADIATPNLKVNINDGGILNMATYSFTSGLAALNGQGTLSLASVNFPTATTNTFVSAGGGTTEYKNAANFTLPTTQTAYNNLRINALGVVATQMSDITLNGNLYIKQGTYRINDNTTAARRALTINGNVTVDVGASITVGTGVTNSTTNPTTVAEGGTAPFVNYYDTQSHRVVVYGDFTNNGTVKFTNLPYPIYNAFPPIVQDATTGFATVYFQGTTNNTLTCNGTTDFYNLVLDKGIDQSFSLTVYSSAYTNFRLFGANNAGGYGGGANPNLNKALWIRTGTLILQGSTIIPTLSEGTGDTGTGGPNSDFYIPANGALTIDGSQVIVLATADDYGEVNVAYGVTGGTGLVNGVGQGGSSSFSVLGKFKINSGYFSTRESGGLITWSDASGQFVIRGGTVDAKQFRSAGTGGGLASFDQSGGTFILRGRFQHHLDYSSIVALKNTTINTVRANDGCLGGTLGTFNLNETANVYTMSGGTINIYDACSTGGRVFDVLSSSGNINVTDGSVQFLPTAGTGGTADAAVQYIQSNAPFGNLTINRISGTATMQLMTYPLNTLGNLTLTSGTLTSSNLNVSVGGNFSIASGTVYNPGTNWTIFNGSGSQNFNVNLLTPIDLNKFKLDKPAGTTLTLAGSQANINVADSMMIVTGNLADGGKTINFAGTIATASYLYNSGKHTGTGKIVLNDDVPQVITGDGNGIFQNLELNNNTGTAPISLGANITVNGVLTLSQDKLFDIKTYNLELGPSATIANAGALRYIQSAGNAGDGGITKAYSLSSPTFTFPIGAPTLSPARAVKYTPATITINGTPTTFGSITVNPVGYEQPATTTKGRSLTYYWRVKSNGFTLGSATVTQGYTYDQSDVVTGPGITENGYVAARYDETNFTWTNGPTTSDIDVTNNIIGEPGAGTFLENVGFIDGDYTAGDNSDILNNPFGTPKKFYSLANGNWDVPATWSNTSHAGPAATTTPGANDIVIVGNGNTVTLTKDENCASLQIEAGSTVDIYIYTGSTFSMVMNNPGGNGLFRVTTPVTANNATPGLFTFPKGDFSDFNTNGGTTEFYDIDGTVGALYILPANVVQYGNLILTAKGGDNLVLPNNAATNIYGDLTCNGDATTAWITMSWNTNIWPYNNNTAYNPTIEKTVHVKGNMFINAGSFEFFNDQSPQHLIVDGNITVAPGAVFEIYPAYPFATPVVNNTVAIGGSLINNNKVTLQGNSGGRTYFVNATFISSTPASITNTLGNPTTIFNNVLVNKGSSQATTLTVDIGGTLTTPNDNWLNLQNGTLIYSRTDPGTNFTISKTTPFTIPASAGLLINYPSNGNNTNILIGDAASNTNDLFLNGKLTVINGNVYVGPTNGTTANNNDIEYSGGGASSIDIQGGNLVVNGQIRRNPATTNGILSYAQSGGNVIINGQAAIPGNAKLEVCNTGSVFNMSGGTITIVRGGGTTFGDLYLRAATSTVTGGEIILTQSPAIGPVVDLTQNYILDANVPLNSLTITGKTAATARNATVKLLISPLTLKGNLTISNGNSFFDANSNFNINVTVKGGFTNNGTYNHYNNITTFSGGSQTIAGSSTTDFYDLVVNPVTSLSLIRDITIFNNLTLSSGQLLNSTFNINLKGNLVNNANYDGDAIQGGVILNGSVLQHLSGTGTFGRLELNNSAGARTESSLTLQKNLRLTAGILDINQHLLTLGAASSIEGSSFGPTKMIASDGVFSNVGLSKYFGIYSGAVQTFIYPIGTSGKYTPAVLSYTDITNTGNIRVNNINSNHPGVLDPNNVLHYYWEVESNGIEGFQGSLVFNYLQGDVRVTGANTEAEYIAAALLIPGTSWIKAGPGGNDLTDNVFDLINEIKFDFPNSNSLSGEYTCGIDAALPNEVPQFKSNKDGNWNDPTIWTQSGGDPYVLTSGPNGFIVTISAEDTVSIDANYAFTYRMTIDGTLKVVYPFMGNNFGTVEGSGKLYLESSTFPAGRYTDFLSCANNATLEYGGTLDYTLISDLYSSIPKLYFSGTGVRTLPNKDLTICTRLLIDGPTLDNSVSNKKLTIEGTMERYNTGKFISGSGAGAIVSFEGSGAQTIGGALGDFTGTNSFNHFTINNSSGLTVNAGGAMEVAGNLLLTAGNITTSSANALTITNTAINCVVPSGGSLSSYVDGPLTKKINPGESFFYPIGKGTILGNMLTLTQTATGTQLWTAEYFTPNSTYASFTAPLSYVNSHDYWTVSGSTGNQAVINLDWDPSSDLTPLMTQNGLSDMRVANYNTGTNSWEEIASGAIGNNNNGTVSTSSEITIPAAGTSDFTLACINIVKPRARLNPTGPVCGGSGIPVLFTGVNSSNLNFILNYNKGGVAQPAVTVNALPYILPTDATGTTYQLTSFTYNNPPHIAPVVTGVVDPAVITSYTVPDVAAAGVNQSLCGANTTTLAGNDPLIGFGVWSIISGTGGTVVNPTVYNSEFNGTLGTTYTLRWTISNGSCSSFDDVIVSFPLLPLKPSAILGDNPVCPGTTGVLYAVTNDPSVTYTWTYTGVNVTITGSGNSRSIDYAVDASGGILSVTATNGCGDSAPQTLNIVVNPIPTATLTSDGGGIVCENDQATLHLGRSGAGTTYTYFLTLPDASVVSFDQVAAPLNPYDYLTANLPWIGPAVNTPYIYKLRVVNSTTGCSSTEVQTTVNVYKTPDTGPNYHISNTFGY